jgi:hypothetical protein
VHDVAQVAEPNAFRDRIDAAAREAGHDLWFDRVRYVERNHEGNMGPFYKYSEWRFVTKAPIEHDHLILLMSSINANVSPKSCMSGWRRTACRAGNHGLGGLAIPNMQ